MFKYIVLVDDDDPCFCHTEKEAKEYAEFHIKFGYRCAFVTKIIYEVTRDD